MKNTKVMPSRATRSLNLRPLEADPATLAVVGEPQKLADGCWRVLADLPGRLLLAKGNEISFLNEDGSLSASAEVADPIVAAGTTLMTARGPVTVAVGDDGEPVVTGETVWPRISIAATPDEIFTHKIPAVAVEKAPAEAMKAYRVLADAVTAYGSLMQPVIARAVIVDASGAVLHAYPPVLVMPPEGPALAASVELQLDSDGKSVFATDVEVDSYRLKLTVEKHSAQLPSGARLRVDVTPQFHPVDVLNSDDTMVTTGRTATKLRVLLPQARHCILPNVPRTSEITVNRALASFESLATLSVDVVDALDGDSDVIKVLTVSGMPAYADELATIRCLMAKTPARVSSGDALLAAPNSFRATDVAVSGDVAVWSGVKPLRFAGHHPSAWIKDFENRNWTGGMAIDFADGSRIVTKLSGNRAPKSLSGLISYPSPDAVRMRFWVLPSGDTNPRGVMVYFNPDESGASSFYLEPGGKEIALGNIDFQLSSVTVRRQASESVTAIATGPNFTDIQAVVSSVNNPVAILPARSSGGAWLFGRTRFYVFGKDGTRVLTIGADRRNAASSLVDSRPVVSRSAVCDAGDSVLVLADGNLLKISGSSVQRICSAASATHVGWDSVRNEALLADSDDNELVHIMLRSKRGSDYISYQSSLAGFSDWSAVAGRVYAVVGDNLHELTQRSASQDVDVVWEAHVKPPRIYACLAAAIWPLKGRNIKATLALKRAWLSTGLPVPGVMATVKIDGAVSMPLAQHVGARASGGFVLSLEGKVGSDFTMQLPQSLFIA